MTPGPLAVNASTFAGMQVGKAAGAVIATFGCVVSGCIIALILYRFFDRFNRNLVVRDVQISLRSVSVGLILSAGASVMLLALGGTMSVTSADFHINCTAIVIFLAALLLLRRFKVNTVLIMVLSGMAGVICYL
mgnify:CR=1 FL=1